MSTVRPGASTDVLHVVVVAATGSDKRGRVYGCKVQACERALNRVIAIPVRCDLQAGKKAAAMCHEGHEDLNHTTTFNAVLAELAEAQDLCGFCDFCVDRCDFVSRN